MNFSSKLLAWYAVHKRDLPWRHTRNPYFIWLSEIILQQTRVEQGLPYYVKFIRQYPTVSHLAKASEGDVLKLWQGLGYYTRARNLHFTAKIICEQHNEKFPEDYNVILKLKGIGRYTAAAIASFAFDLPYPVVDGNVQRVLARIYGISDPIHSSTASEKFYALAGRLMDIKNPGAFNQAMMEFGALMCIPAGPKCGDCPFRKQCLACRTGTIKDLPARQMKAKPRKRYFNYLVITKGENIFLSKRTNNDIWKNLFEFQMIETEKQFTREEIMNSAGWKSLFGRTRYRVNPQAISHTHSLSHQEIHARFWEIVLPVKPAFATRMKSFYEIKIPEIKTHPVSRLIEKYFGERYPHL